MSYNTAACWSLTGHIRSLCRLNPEGTRDDLTHASVFKKKLLSSIKPNAGKKSSIGI